MRWLVLAAAAISLSGCGLPAVVSVWSTALDFASYGSTGKTVTDHGLSMVLQQDCALLRGLQGEVCVEEGSEHASKTPVKEPETSASGRVAYLQEEANRASGGGQSWDGAVSARTRRQRAAAQRLRDRPGDPTRINTRNR